MSSLSPSCSASGVLLLTMLSSVSAAEKPIDFVDDIQPIFAQHCIACHGPEQQKGSFRLDVKRTAMAGGETGVPAIVAGKSDESQLLDYVAGPDPVMPPEGERLSDGQIARLRAWIDQGATWPDAVATAPLEDKTDHWAFKPLNSTAESLDSAVEQPPAAGSGGADPDLQTFANPIDRFIAAKLRERGLTMAPPADRRTLIRRVSLVLHGLPPSPEEVEAFVADADPLAYDRLVDRMLASPRYGERWARHWLDVIAFGETHGFEVNTPRENAWPYRDYVIQAFNRDTPYPRFIMEQLAGDTLGVDAATGFLVASAALLQGQIGKDEESKLKARQDELSDMVATAGGAFLGLTLHCARCHDHKFDPVSQSDYYSVQAIFAGVRHGERPMEPPDLAARKQERAALTAELAGATHRLLQYSPLAVTEGPRAALRGSVDPRRNVDRFAPVEAHKLRFTVLATSENDRYEPCLDELEIYTTGGRNVALATAGAQVRASGSWNSSKHRLEHLNDGRYGNDRSWISTTRGRGWVEVAFRQPERIEAVVWGRDRTEAFRDRLAVAYRIEVAGADDAWSTVATSEDRAPWSDAGARAGTPQLSDLTPPDLTPAQRARWRETFDQVAALEEQLSRFSTSGPLVYAGRFEQPGPTYRLYRGEATQPREEVPPAAVSAIGPELQMPTDAPEHERRIALARWLADPENPLPARVLVNRLWQHHFGEGIVSTPSDFGRNGALPTHAELLDWMAGEFIRSGGSIKRIQRMILTTATWKQSSAPRREPLAADAACRLLWRFPPRRLEAEAIRDSMLVVAGTMDLRMGGPGFSVFAPNSNYVRVYDPKLEFGPAEWRRMIYMTKVRMAQDATFGAFDCPDAGQPQPKRPRSTTPLQALNLFNSGFVTQQADLFAQRLKHRAGDEPAAQIQDAFSLVFQRPPTRDEAQVCAALVREHGLATLCRVLLNSNEFLFVP